MSSECSELSSRCPFSAPMLNCKGGRRGRVVVTAPLSAFLKSYGSSRESRKRARIPLLTLGQCLVKDGSPLPHRAAQEKRRTNNLSDSLPQPTLKQPGGCSNLCQQARISKEPYASWGILEHSKLSHSPSLPPAMLALRSGGFPTFFRH